MSNTQTQTLTADDLTAIARRAGLRITPQKGFIKCEGPGKAVYISNTKKGVTQVHLAGAVMPEDVAGYVALSPEEAKAHGLGAVRAIMKPEYEGFEDAFQVAVQIAADPTPGFKGGRGGQSKLDTLLASKVASASK